MNILKSFFRKLGNRQLDKLANNDALPQISPDTEVWLIKDGLEKKFGHPFQAKIKVDGYLGDMEYRLVLNDYHIAGLKQSHSVWGAAVTDVLDLKTAFVSGYWDSLRRARQKLTETANVSDFDRRNARGILDTAVAGSREELIMRAAVEGKI